MGSAFCLALEIGIDGDLALVDRHRREEVNELFQGEIRAVHL